MVNLMKVLLSLAVRKKSEGDLYINGFGLVLITVSSIVALIILAERAPNVAIVTSMTSGAWSIVRQLTKPKLK